MEETPGETQLACNNLRKEFLERHQKQVRNLSVRSGTSCGNGNSEFGPASSSVNAGFLSGGDVFRVGAE
jgi:hypothetical protein